MNPLDAVLTLCAGIPAIGLIGWCLTPNIGRPSVGASLMAGLRMCGISVVYTHLQLNLAAATVALMAVLWAVLGAQSALGYDRSRVG